MTMTEYVRRVQTAVSSFPGMLKGKIGDQVQYYDLSQTPPELRTFTSKQIVSTERDDKWKHPPAMANYTPQELTDIIAFLKWTTTGSQKEVTVAELEPAK